jgi:hypothetical protein
VHFKGALGVSLGAGVVMTVAYLLSRAGEQKGSEDKLERLEGIISVLRDIQQADVK